MHRELAEYIGPALHRAGYWKVFSREDLINEMEARIFEASSKLDATKATGEVVKDERQYLLRIAINAFRRGVERVCNETNTIMFCDPSPTNRGSEDRGMGASVLEQLTRKHSPAAHTDVIHRDQLRTLKRALYDISYKSIEYRVIIKGLIRGETIAELSKTLGMPPMTVHDRVKQIRAILKGKYGISNARN